MSARPPAGAAPPELLPCPFCGFATPRSICIGGMWTIQCAALLADENVCNAGSGLHQTETEAAAAWNRRRAPVAEPAHGAAQHEVRFDQGPEGDASDTVDEVVGVGSYHLEMMADNSLWMQLGPDMFSVSARGRLRFIRTEAGSRATSARSEPPQDGGADAEIEQVAVQVPQTVTMLREYARIERKVAMEEPGFTAEHHTTGLAAAQILDDLAAALPTLIASAALAESKDHE